MLPGKSLSVLVVGSGGREHALVRAALASPLVRSVHATPGNAGIAAECQVWGIPADDVGTIASAATERGIDFAIVGPEVPLALGLVDRLSDHGILCFGPRAAAARLEASKVFAKRFLLRHGIPTAPATIHTDIASARTSLPASGPVVVKADGLAAGKGVIVAPDRDTAEAAVRSCLVDRTFGAAGSTVLIEECLTGREASIHVLVSGRDFTVLPTSQDHKRVGDGDTGPNTGGMGAYSPAEWIDGPLLDRIRSEVILPTLAGFQADGIDYRGVLFIGVMVTEDGPRVLEYNVRFGDPETQVLLPRFASDPIEALLAVATGSLASHQPAFRPDAALAIVLASRGYPGPFPTGSLIRLPEAPEGVSFFQGGTSTDSAGRLVTSGGRVLTVSALGTDLPAAAARAYAAAGSVHFDTCHFRRDIGHQVLLRPR